MEEIKPFDLTVHVKDTKTQKIIKVQPYVRHCHKIEGQSNVLFEREGQFFHENNGTIPVADEDNFVLKARASKAVDVKPAGPKKEK